MTKRTVSAGAREQYGREALEKVRRGWGTLILVSGNFLSALAVVLLGGWGILPRFLLSLASGFIVMSILFLVLLKHIARGRGWGWLLTIIGCAVFVLVAKLPSTLIPFKPMSLVDMIQAPLSGTVLLVGLLVLLGFLVAFGSLAVRRD